jgi:beta-galactosidase
LEPAFQWSAQGDWSSALATAIVCSNCEHLEFYIGSKLVAEANPDSQNFGHLPHPPFQVKLDDEPWGELRIEGYIAGRKVVEKRYSAMGVDREFLVSADDSSLMADGADTTRVSFKVADEFGNLRRYSTTAIALAVEGPVELIGENPFSLVGGCGALWLRAKEQAGKAKLSATHPVLGIKTVELPITATEMERV